MKKLIYLFIAGGLLFSVQSCDVLEEAAGALGTNSSSGTSSSSLTNQEVISGLKEALNVGIKNAVDVTSITDGFFKNSEIKIPFPESANAVKEKAIEWGMSGQVDKIVLTLNRAAEDAAKEATPIFLNAIKNMTIQDGFAILNGGDGAATNFLRKNTTDALVTAFSPKVQNSIEKVKLTEYWEPVATKYNQAMMLTGGKKVEVDLNKYVTEKAINGLFNMVEKEENKIRKDPVARVTEILQKVFGSIGK
ncbi:MAG: DUF4197 domain-containing protein [Brumimicrobium sp.]|nr:DUF4197 domain-containing protein [Brumimicrobium sp.]MCO5268160.1 DUF4197 domain-containing protein [Brumimicrobium sp.]